MKTTVTDKYGTRVYGSGGQLISGTPLPSTPTVAPKKVTTPTVAPKTVTATPTVTVPQKVITPTAAPAATGVPYGMTPATYAEEIKRKQAAGIPFTDSAAAAAFQKANPQYFAATPPSAPPPAPASKPAAGDWTADTAYRQSLLDPNTVPTGLTRPTEGVSRSNDIIRTEYRTTESGNVERLDHLVGGQVNRTFIPNVGDWRQTGSGFQDPALGDVYNRQLSAYEAQTSFVRDPERFGVTPSWFTPGAHEQSLQTMLARTTPPPPGSIPPAGGVAPPAGGGSLNPLDYPSFDAYQAATAGRAAPPPPGGAAPPAAGDWWSQTYTGGREGYAASQQQRYAQARAAGDTDLMRRLEADAQRVGYSLAPAGGAAPPGGGAAPPAGEQPLLPPYIPPEMAPFAPPPVPYQQEVDQLLRQIQELTGQPVRPEDYPGYQGMQEASQQQAAKASQQAMEILNQRGILNSTVTRDQVNEIEQQAMIQLMPRLFELAYGMRQDQISQLMNLLNTYSGLGQQEYTREVESQRWFYEQQVAQQAAAIEAEEQKVKAAWDRVKNLGYVDNTASVALGIPVGTPTYEAQKDVENRLHQLQLAREQISGAMARTQSTQGQISARAATPKAGTQTERDRTAMADAYQAIDDALAQGIHPNQISKEIMSQMSDLTRRGIDPKDLYDYLDAAYGVILREARK